MRGTRLFLSFALQGCEGTKGEGLGRGVSGLGLGLRGGQKEVVEGVRFRVTRGHEEGSQLQALTPTSSTPLCPR